MTKPIHLDIAGIGFRREITTVLNAAKLQKAMSNIVDLIKDLGVTDILTSNYSDIENYRGNIFAFEWYSKSSENVKSKTWNVSDINSIKALSDYILKETYTYGIGKQQSFNNTRTIVKPLITKYLMRVSSELLVSTVPTEDKDTALALKKRHSAPVIKVTDNLAVFLINNFT